MPETVPSRDELASLYLDQLRYEPYRVQEEALLAWFEAEQGVLVCAPTGTGKTLIAEAALFEALHTRQVAYYTTPLIALTEQKFREMQDAAERWGFSRDDVGLVTGNRCVNPEATVLVVVAEILLNRLLHPAAFEFSQVAAVVMDEFHSFADPERGIVWELSLALLPPEVRLLLLSATVGNSADFIIWLNRSHGRKVQLIQSTDRKVPLRFSWVPDQLLNERVQLMATGDDDTKRTPALIFCFNREQCWSVAEQLKGKHLLDSTRQEQLVEELKAYDWTEGVGPKLKQVLLRGVGVHHAGLLPKYRRIVEALFQRKLLSICVCTETLAAGINLPARSVVLTTLLKGPPGKKKLVDSSSMHQMCGRAGRPQFDTEGYVFALPHEDDVKIARWKEKHDTIPDDTKDPNLRKAKKRLQKKMPQRRKTEQYWNEAQFEKLVVSPPGSLASRGQLPWRLLAYLLTISPEVERLQTVVSKRLLDAKRVETGQRALNGMLMTLWAGGYVKLDPEPPAPQTTSAGTQSKIDDGTESSPEPTGTFGALLQQARRDAEGVPSTAKAETTDDAARSYYEPKLAQPTADMHRLLPFRSVNPLYADFLVKQLGIADEAERIQALESVLEMPGSVAKLVRVPQPEEFPPGPLATESLDDELIQRGLATAEELYPKDRSERMGFERRWAMALAEKLRMLFDAELPNVRDIRTVAVWSAGDLLNFEGDFNKYVKGRGLAKQEGIFFRHFLRLILLCEEFAQVCPPGITDAEWGDWLRDLAAQLTASCRRVDPESTDKAIESAHAVADVVNADESADGVGSDLSLS